MTEEPQIVLGGGGNVDAVTLGVRDGTHLVAEKRCHWLRRDVQTFFGRIEVEIEEEYEGKKKGDGPLIVMDLIPGGNLAEIIDHHFQVQPIPAFTLFQRFKMAYDLAYQVTQMHERNIIHRDLKTQNVMVDENFMCVLIDFDFGRNMRLEALGEKDLTYFTGTFLYNPPELQGTEALDDFCKRAREDTKGQDDTVLFQKWVSKIDVYQFGMILYEMFTGIVPFSDQCLSPEELSKRLRTGSIHLTLNDPCLRECPRSVLDLIGLCVTYQPEKRPSMEEVKNAIRDAFEDCVDLIEYGDEFFEFCESVDNGDFDKPVRHGTLENLRRCADMEIPWSIKILEQVEKLHLGQ